MEEEIAPKKPGGPGGYEIGQPLDNFSIEEIGGLIESLKSEIERLQAAMQSKTQHRDAADALFGKK